MPICQFTCGFLGRKPLMISCHPAKFGGHLHCDSRNKICLVVKEQDLAFLHGMIAYIHSCYLSLKLTTCSISCSVLAKRANGQWVKINIEK